MNGDWSMLDTSFHQGSGLHSFTPEAALRLLAVASQDNAATGLEVLWQICASLQRLGYPVVVLDGTAQESADSPGLIHLLQRAPWNEGVDLNLGAMASSLAVIPAARGLHHLTRLAQDPSSSPLARLLPYFRTYGLLVLHAPAATLGPLLTQVATTPLVVMGAGAAGVMTSYKSLKQIALDSGLSWRVAALLHGGTGAERRKAQSALQTLQDCAERHVGGPVRTTTIATQNPQDLQRLALQLLENAGTINEPMPALPIFDTKGVHAHTVRSH